GGFSRDAGSGVGRGAGSIFGANATFADAPNRVWSYRVSAGYFNSDAFSRPTGRIPVIQDPRNPSATVGGAAYPQDGTGPTGTAARASRNSTSASTRRSTAAASPTPAASPPARGSSTPASARSTSRRAPTSATPR